MSIHIDESAQHAIYAPSAGHVWAKEDGCTAAPEAVAAVHRVIAPEEGPEAAEGTRAHDEIERCFQRIKDVTDWRTVVDPEHPAAYGIALVMHYVQQLQTLYPGTLWIEQRVILTKDIWGRCDVSHWHEETGTLTIVDFKNGFVGVDPDTEQLRIYAAAAVYTHKLPVQWIRYAVVQPNDFRPVPRVKPWMESAESLFKFATRVAAIPAGPKTFVAGEQCTYCPLFGRCEASKDMLANVGALVAGLMTADQVSAEQRAIFMNCEKPIVDAFKNAKKVWQKEALSGTVPPDLKLVTSQGHKAWSDPEAARALVIERLGVSALDVPTPAQAIERGIPEDIVNPMAPRPPGGPVLAFASDKRPEWKQKSAAEMFAGVAQLKRS
jgi:hypothetical protein